MVRMLCALYAAGAASVLFGGTVLTDFETPDEIASAPHEISADTRIEVTNRFALSGFGCLRAWKAKWTEGKSDTAGVRLKFRPRITDWRGYDRLAIELYNDGSHGDWIYLYAQGADTPWEEAMYGRQALPAHGRCTWIIPVKGKGPAFDPADVTQVLLQTSSKPKGFDVYIDRIMLLKPGEELPPLAGSGFSGDFLPEAEARISALETELEDTRAAVRHLESVRDFKAACVEAGSAKGGFCLGWARPTEQVMPRDAFRARPATELGLRLARNEYESIQLVVLPDGADAEDVRVSVEGLDLPAAVKVVGYVKTTRPCYPVPAVGWWPDPLLGFLDGIRIAKDDAQGFWLTVRAPKDAAAGIHRGTVRVRAKGGTVAEIPLAVRVNGFTLPDNSMLPLAIAFKPWMPPDSFPPEEYARLKADRNVPANAWARHSKEWYRLLIDYKITPMTIYCKPPWCRLNFDLFKRMADHGRLGLFCLGYFDAIPPGEGGLEAWRTKFLPQFRENHEKAKELGLLGKAFFYGADELHEGQFARVAAALAEMKREFPDVPCLSTAVDPRLGCDGSLLSQLDWFCPTPDNYDPAQVAKARAAGKKVWWYTANQPPAPYPQTCIDTPLIMMRMLMGALAAKFRPEGYLYYSITHWRATKTIDGGPFTDWPGRSFREWNGDGSWLCAGPDGIPLPTLRLENFRDGLEDYAYAMLLEAAGEKVEVPREIVRAANDFTLDADRLEAWRNELADRLERK